MTESKPLIVLQNVQAWLPLTMPWLYDQVRFLPPEINSHVFCEKTLNLETFPIGTIHSFQSAPKLRQILDQILKLTGVRRELGYFTDLAREIRPQILHSHFLYTAWGSLDMATKLKCRHALSCYGADISYHPRQNPRWLKRMPKIFEKISAVFCEGPHMGNTVEGLGCPRDKIHIHHLGVPVQDIEYRPRVWKKGDPLRVLIAATFRQKKGIPIALEALGRVRDLVPLEIVLIGDATKETRSLQEKQKILETIKKWNLDSLVKMPGFQSRETLGAEADQCHLFLAPSITAEDGDTEGGAPVVLLEMLAGGIPVIASTHCDVPHIVRHEHTGRTAQEGSVDSLVDQLEIFIKDPDAWRPMLDQGRSLVENEFNAQTQGLRLGQLYRKIADPN